MKTPKASGNCNVTLDEQYFRRMSQFNVVAAEYRPWLFDLTVVCNRTKAVSRDVRDNFKCFHCYLKIFSCERKCKEINFIPVKFQCQKLTLLLWARLAALASLQYAQSTNDVDSKEERSS